MKKNIKSDPTLYELANAIREMLGLDPIPNTKPDARYAGVGRTYVLEEERATYAHVYPWPREGQTHGQFSRQRGAVWS